MSSFLMIGWSKVKHHFGVTGRHEPLRALATTTDRTRFAESQRRRRAHQHVVTDADLFGSLSGRPMVVQGGEYLDVVDDSLDRVSKQGWAAFAWIRVVESVGDDPVVLFASAPPGGVRGVAGGTGRARVQLSYVAGDTSLVAEFWSEDSASVAPERVEGHLAAPLGTGWHLIGLELGPYDSGGTTAGKQMALVVLSVDGVVVSRPTRARMPLPDSLGGVFRVCGRFPDAPSSVARTSGDGPAMEFAGLSVWRCVFNPMRRAWLRRSTAPSPEVMTGPAQSAAARYNGSAHVQPVGLWLGSEGDPLTSPNRVGEPPLRLNRPREFRVGPLPA